MQKDLKKAEDYGKGLLPTINFDIITNLFDLFKIIINLIDDIINIINDIIDEGGDPNSVSNSNNDPSSTNSESSSSSSSSSSAASGEIIWDTAPAINAAQYQMMAATIASDNSQLACLTPGPDYSLIGSLCNGAPASSNSNTDTTDTNTAYPPGGNTGTYEYPTTSYTSDGNTDPTSYAFTSTVVVYPTPTSTTTVVVVVTPTPPPFGVMTPSGHGIDCHTDVDYVALSDCYSIDLSLIDANTVYSTEDKICYAQGDVIDSEVQIGNWCQIGYNGLCSLVWGQDLSFGNSARISRFKGQDLLDFVSGASQKCGSGSGAVISTTSKDPNLAAGGWSASFCLVFRGQENACGTNQGFPEP